MWDSRYSEDGFAYGTEPNDFLKLVVDKIPEGKILSLADGEGRNSVFLAQQGYEVFAVDASKVGLEKANKLAEERGVFIRTECVDLAGYKISENNYDGIVSIFCHLPPRIRKDVHAQVVKGLKPGGVLVLEAYTPEQLNYKTGGPPVAEMMMTLEALSDELNGLEFIHAEEVVRDVVEGKYHTGPAAVVQIIATKTK